MADGEGPKMSLTNLRTEEELEAQFQPEELEVTHGATFNELAILGYSHKPLQYTGSENLEIAVLLRFHRRWRGHQLGKTHRFIHSLTHPQRADSVDGAGTPDVLFFWPGFYSVVSKVRSFKEKTKSFAFNGEPLYIEYEIKMHRISSVRILSEDVRAYGMTSP